jgi:CHASE3 domain sensor protein
MKIEGLRVGYKSSMRRFLVSIIAVSIIVDGTGVMAQDAAIASAPKLYSFDIFSLLSFGLTITALLLSFFMAWLSWQFYSKSIEASEKTHETVTKIEGLVAGVQSNISDIVNKAVTHWVEGGEASSLGEANHDLMQKFAELEAAISNDNGQDQSEVLTDIKELRHQVEQLSRSSREIQIKSIFPNFGSEQKVVEASQEITSSDEGSQKGVLRIMIIRPTKIATAALHFEPAFKKAPVVSAELISSPPMDNTATFSAKPGTPSEKSCNFHLNSGSELPAGEYVFEFDAASTK